MTAELDDAVLIIDDSSGRGIAAALGIRYTGTVGLLIAAKRAGRVTRIAPLLDDLPPASAILDQR